MKKQNRQYRVKHTTAQKIWGVLALVALFVCGFMVGWGINSGKSVEIKSAEQIAEPQPITDVQPQETCVIIEDLLLEQLPPASANGEHRIYRAKIYANLSERGCAENSQRYVDLAAQELEIARALEDDEFEEAETIEVVETYKRLNMQAAAEEIFETAKKLTDPAIDFILEVEKIINEQQ